MKEYRYFGSAPHLAFTSILVGAVFWQQFVVSTEKNGMTLLGIGVTTLVLGLLLLYGYKFVVVKSFPEPLRLKKLPLSLLIMNLALLGFVFSDVVPMMRNLSEQASFAEFKIILAYSVSILIGVNAIISAPKLKYSITKK